MPEKKTLKKDEIKTLGLSSLGGMLEFYDFIIFVFFAQYISAHFFPKDLGVFWKDLNTYGAFAAGYLARPIGGIIMGHFGDKLGRKKMFMLSILLMVIPTLSLGLVPTFESIGYFAPIFLLIVRIFQGVAIGGELPGAWVFVREHSPRQYKGVYLAILTASVVGGIFLGALVALILGLVLSEESLRDWGWRIPFLLGGGFGIISIYLRRFLSETPVFKKMKKDKSLEKFPLKEVFKTSKRGIVISMFSTWVLAGCIIVIVLFLPNYMQDVLKFDSVQRSLIQIFGVLCLIAGCGIAGVCADRWGVSRGYKVWAVYLAVVCIVFFHCFYQLQNSTLSVLSFLLLCNSVGIMVFTPVVMCELFESKFKFSAISFSYNIAYAIVGGITPQLAFALHTLSKKQGIYAYGLCAYILILCLVAYGVACAYKQLVEKE